MITTDFKIAVKNIKRNKVQSSISILGLGIGLGSMILLMSLIVHEKSFDRFIPDYPNVYKVIFGSNSFAQYPLADAMKKDFPEVKDFFRINQANIVQVRNIKRNEYGGNQEFAFSDSSIFRILGIKLLAGTPAKSYTEVAISEKMARKYFGNTPAVGEILRVKLNNEFIDLSVSGVYKDFPANSTLFPDFLATIKLSEKLFGIFITRLGEYGSGTINLNWDLTTFYTYVVLDKNANIKTLVSKMQKYRELISSETSKKLKYDLQPVCDIYLKSDRYLEGFQFFRAGNANELKYYWSVSFLILLISVTNYIFLTRAATSDRLRELGTRKVLGASSKNIRRQIILESNLVTLLSLIPASFVIDSGMTFINTTLNKTLSNEVFSNPVMWLLLLSVVIFTGTISGLLIGYNISQISPLVLLSGKSSVKSRSKNWNYSYLIFHFSVYIILVVSVISVTKQVKYAQTKYSGINPDNILISELNSQALQSGFSSICSEMERIPGVKKVAGSSFIPFFTDYFSLPIKNKEGEIDRFEGLIMGEGMTELLNIELIEGLPFGAYNSSAYEILFNESSAKKYNLKVGDKYLGIFKIRGIVKDFHSHSLHTSIEPMVILQQNPAKMGFLVIKTDGTNDKTIVLRLRELYNQIAPDEIFEVKYLAERMKDLYSHEKNQARIMGAFSILTTVLAFMGLFGIALISITRKTKEIGLRKVNGASIAEVIFLLNKDFIRWVLVSLLIGIPVSYYLMSNWQNRFAYKTDLSWWIFTIAGISAILIAVLTVSSQSWRTATRNPVDSLRYE
ncbi:MAG: ABC transporter permease [Bacteroidota bacterium]